jgi:hypothetical protein
MSRPDNQTSGRYYLRSGNQFLSTPTAHSSGLLPTSLTGATFTSPIPILFTPSPPLPPIAPVPDDHPDDASDISSSQSSSSLDVAPDSDSDSDDMAGSLTTLVPSPFTGRHHEDVLEFIKNFELWATFRKMDEESKLAALPLLLKDGAAMWYNTQPHDTHRNFADLRQALGDRYGPTKSDAWKRAAELWQMKQSSKQSTDDFITSVQQAAQKLDVAVEQTFLVTLNGLRPNIRQHVIQHDPKTIDDIQKWGRLTEVSQEDTHDAEQHLRETVRELAAVKEELKQLQLTNLAAITASRHRSRSPTPHRVTFAQPPAQSTRHQSDDYAMPPSHEYRKHQQQPDSYYAAPPPSLHHQTHQQPFDDYAMSSSRQQRPPRQHFQHYDPSAATQQPENRRQQAAWRPTQNYSASSCGNCGGKHGPQGSCRAKGLTCFYCGKRGHLQSVCRAAKGRYNSH